MTIEQTINVPLDRRITVDLPPTIPTGQATIKLSISTPPEKPVKMSRQMRNIMKYYGCLKDSPAFEGDPVEIQHQMRSEWDRSWDT
jgi:hypothetical protein